MALTQRFMRSRPTQVGVIRAGLAPGAAGNTRKGPVGVDEFRVTSSVESIICQISDIYGGIVTPFDHPSQGRQWQVMTEASTLDVTVPGQIIDPTLELWKGGATLDRRCDGDTESLRGVRCLCDPQGVMTRDDPRRLCSVTTRMRVGLSQIQTSGIFGLVTHGWQTTDEWLELNRILPLLIEGRLSISGTLTLQRRTSNTMGIVGGREKMIAKNYVVPVWLFDDLTSRVLAAGGEAIRSAILANQARELETATPQRAAMGSGRVAAIEAAPAGESEAAHTARLLAALATAETHEAINTIWVEARENNLTGLIEPVRTKIAEIVAQATPVDPEPAPGETASPEPSLPASEEFEEASQVRARLLSALAGAETREDIEPIWNEARKLGLEDLVDPIKARVAEIVAAPANTEPEPGEEATDLTPKLAEAAVQEAFDQIFNLAGGDRYEWTTTQTFQVIARECDVPDGRDAPLDQLNQLGARMVAGEAIRP